MKLLKRLIACFLLAMPVLAHADKFSLHDEGDFQPVGQRVEFYDRFGWAGYSVDFDFDFDEDSRALTKGSKLKLRIFKRQGRDWDYTCKSSGKRALAANVNFLLGKGISIVAECRIEAKAFGKLLGLYAEDVGSPGLIFHALIQEGKVVPGAQRGIYLAPAAEIAATELAPYVPTGDDPTALAVVFQSRPQ
jgi:hypothetical protein